MIGLAPLVSEGGVRTLGWALGHSLWQGALVALAVGVCLHLVSRKNARLRYRIAAIGLTVFVLGTSMTAMKLVADWREHEQCWKKAADGELSADAGRRCTSHGVFARASSAVAFSGKAAESHSHVASRLRAATLALTPAAAWATILWMIGLAVLATRFVHDLLLVRRLRRTARSLPEPSARAPAARAATRIGLRRPVPLGLCAGIDTPCVVGCARPLVLLPEWVTSTLQPAELEPLLAHEFAHVRRHDYAANLVQRGVEAVFFFNPFVLWISRQVRDEREASCDRLAAGRTPASLRHYISALAAVERLRSDGRIAAAGFALHAGGRLLRRVERLVETSRPAPRRLALRCVVGAVALAAAAASWRAADAVGRALSSYSVMALDVRHREPVVLPTPPPSAD